MHITIFGFKLDVQLIILACVIYSIMVCSTICGCCKKSAVDTIKIVSSTAKEGFTNNINQMGGHNSEPHTLGSDSVDSSTWGAADFSSMSTPDSVKFLNRPEQTVPIPEGQMSFFDTTKFSLDCCPNTYSTSSGCACMTLDQQQYLRSRGNSSEGPEF
jgi:hypothetical protein